MLSSLRNNTYQELNNYYDDNNIYKSKDMSCKNDIINNIILSICFNIIKSKI